MLMIDVGLIGLGNSKYTCTHVIYLLYPRNILRECESFYVLHRLCFSTDMVL